MSKKTMALVASALLLGSAAACAHTPFRPVQLASAIILGPEGQQVGQVKLSESAAGVRMDVSVAGLAPGLHGMHLHAVGKCEGPAFATAGGHINPLQKQHGTENPAGSHMGDLPNLQVAADGAGRAEIVVDGAVLVHEAGLFDADGAALVIHSSADDYRTDPTGNSGARVACGAFTRG